MLEWGREHLAKRLAETYVEEVGRAAIDLYGGRLRVSAEQLADHVSAASERDSAQIEARLREPVRILVAGQVSAGKSSLVNALANEMNAAVDALPATSAFAPYELKREGFPAALLIDSPGLGQNPAQRTAVIEKAAGCDLVLWVSAAHRADREIDRAALVDLRRYFEARPNRRRPPAVLVLTNIDRLRPFKEWSPPYDLTRTGNGKAASIRTAIETASEELGFDQADIVPVCLAESVGRYNVDAVWGKMIETLPEVQSAQLVRCLRAAQSAWDLKRIWSQAMSGGRVLARTALR
jgi:predicted GTPase